MSDGIAKVAGAPSVITLKGREYFVRPIRFADFASIERYLQSKRPNLLAQLVPSLAGMSDDVKNSFIAAAVKQMDTRQNVSTDDITEFMNSFDGMTYAFWLLMKDAHPELESSDAVAALVEDIDLTVLGDMLDRVSGLSDLKNSAGRDEKTDPAQKTAKLAALANQATGAHESLGHHSITG